MPLPYFPFYPRQWLGSGKVLAMPNEARGAYIHLMACMWDRGDGRCELPSDEDALRRMVGATPKEWARILPWLKQVLDFSDTVTEPHLTVLFENAQTKSERATNAVNTRWSRGRNAHAGLDTDVDTIVHTDVDTSEDTDAYTDDHTPAIPPREEKSTDVNPPIAPPGGQRVNQADKPYSAEFEQFWAVYPRKDEKRAAWVKWQTRLKDRVQPVTAAQLIVAARRYAEATKGSDHVKEAKTFLGSSRPYEDYLRPTAPGKDAHPSSASPAHREVHRDD